MESFVDDFLTIKFDSGITANEDAVRLAHFSLRKFILKQISPSTHPIDVFIFWWRNEDLLLTAKQMVYASRAVSTHFFFLHLFVLP